MTSALIQRSRYAVLLLSAVALAVGVSVPSTAMRLLAATQPLVMTGTFTSRPGQQYVQMAMDNYIIPTHPGTGYSTAIPLTTPEQAWPITGLFDHTFGRSVAIGLSDLERDVAEQGTADPIVIFGYSQSAVISTEYKRLLAASYPGANNAAAPDISFVLIGNLNRPNGGVMTRFEGAYLPLINFYFNGPAPTDTSFQTVDIARQYDGFADFPLYPLNFVSTANALAGIAYVHTDYQATTLAPTPPADTLQGTFGDTTYYLIPTEHLPLLQLPRDLGVPEPVIAAIEPTLRVIVELGYDREVGPWVPTRARLFPDLDFADVADDLAQAAQQGAHDALAEIADPTPRAPGPTPTERVVTDLVRLNVTNTLSDLTGRRSTAASEAEVTATEASASEPEHDADSPNSLRPRARGPMGRDLPSVRDVVRTVRDQALSGLGGSHRPAATNDNDSDDGDDGAGSGSADTGPSGSEPSD